MLRYRSRIAWRSHTLWASSRLESCLTNSSVLAKPTHSLGKSHAAHPQQYAVPCVRCILEIHRVKVIRAHCPRSRRLPAVQILGHRWANLNVALTQPSLPDPKNTVGQAVFMRGISKKKITYELGFPFLIARIPDSKHSVMRGGETTANTTGARTAKRQRSPNTATAKLPDVLIQSPRRSTCRP